ncbi:MAG: ABC transporter permease [Mesorhizobium sp.]|nr:MAG: ABC transporter permease [Mesorhizobium sp.]
MLAFLFRRSWHAVITLIVMAIVVFFAIHLIGNPVDVLARPDATPLERAQIARELGLDQPIWVQFAVFLENAVRGDLGVSFVYNRSAVDVILERIPATAELVITALILSISIGVPLGLIAGLWADSWLGRAIMAGSTLGFSLPSFWIGLVLILVFAVQLGWLPAGGRGMTSTFLGIESALFSYDGLKHLILPAATLALHKASLVIRVAQAGTREVIRQDYIRFARAKGLRQSRILSTHVLKNILLPVITIVGLELGSMIAFAVVTETVFAYPGMGKLLIDSINRLDRPVVVAYLMLAVLIFIVINLAVDILYAIVDPRVRLSEASGQ